jgi:hypothetical protein
MNNLQRGSLVWSGLFGIVIQLYRSSCVCYTVCVLVVNFPKSFSGGIHILRAGRVVLTMLYCLVRKRHDFADCKSSTEGQPNLFSAVYSLTEGLKPNLHQANAMRFLSAKEKREWHRKFHLFLAVASALWTHILVPTRGVISLYQSARRAAALGTISRCWRIPVFYYLLRVRNTFWNLKAFVLSVIALSGRNFSCLPEPHARWNDLLATFFKMLQTVKPLRFPVIT